MKVQIFLATYSDDLIVKFPKLSSCNLAKLIYLADKWCIYLADKWCIYLADKRCVVYNILIPCMQNVTS